ncbi:MAG: hypothetical protein ACRCX2_28265 [Paraclostridium sp.]
MKKLLTGILVLGTMIFTGCEESKNDDKPIQKEKLETQVLYANNNVTSKDINDLLDKEGSDAVDFYKEMKKAFQAKSPSDYGQGKNDFETWKEYESRSVKFMKDINSKLRADKNAYVLVQDDKDAFSMTYNPELKRWEIVDYDCVAFVDYVGGSYDRSYGKNGKEYEFRDYLTIKTGRNKHVVFYEDAQSAKARGKLSVKRKLVLSSKNAGKKLVSSTTYRRLDWNSRDYVEFANHINAEIYGYELKDSKTNEVLVRKVFVK